MKRYLLFAFDTYYPTGGWNDFKGSFDSIKAAKEWKDGEWEYEHHQIVDRLGAKEIVSGDE